MSFKLRMIVLSIFVFLFIISAPLLLLHTSGFRYNFKKHKIEKVGAFIISTIPENTTILIDGQAHLKNEKTTIIDMLPDNHLVEIKKNGYYPWHKNLLIKPNLSTPINDVRLFKHQLPTILISGDLKKIFYSPNKIYAAAQKKGQIILINLKNTQITPLIDIPSTHSLTKIRWSQNSADLLLHFKKQNNQNLFSIIQLKNPNNNILLPSYGYTDYIWDPKDYKNIYGRKSNKIIQISLNDFSQTEIYSSPNNTLQSYIVYNHSIFTILNNKNLNQDNLIKIHTKDKTITSISQIPYSSDYKLKFSEYGKYLLVKDIKRKIIYFILPNKTQPDNMVEILPKVKNCINQHSADQFVCYNDLELITFNPQTANKMFINRFSTPLKQVIPHSNSQYISFLTGNSLKILELDSRDNRNIITVNTLTQTKNVLLDEDNNKFYFYAVTGSTGSLYKLGI